MTVAVIPVILIVATELLPTVPVGAAIVTVGATVQDPPVRVMAVTLSPVSVAIAVGRVVHVPPDTVTTGAEV